MRTDDLKIPDHCSICSQPLLRVGLAALGVLLYMGADPDPAEGETNADPPLRAFHPRCARLLNRVLSEARLLNRVLSETMLGADVTIPAVHRPGSPRLVAEYPRQGLDNDDDDEDA